MDKKKVSKIKLVMVIILMLLLIFPYSVFNIIIPRIIVNDYIYINIVHIGMLFMMVLIYLFDLYIKKTRIYRTKLENIINRVITKTSILIIILYLTGIGYLHFIIPSLLFIDMLVYILKDNRISKLYVFKEIVLNIVIFLLLLNNFPLSLINLEISYLFVILLSILVIIYIANTLFGLGKTEVLGEEKE